jgi:transcriptional regulator with XRE-family HTH domain
MDSINETGDAIAQLGTRLRTARLARNEPMAVFARRIGVSVPTLRHMESGLTTVQIGYWANALWTLGRLDDVRTLLAPQGDLISRARIAQAPQRRRARRQRSAQE